MFRKKLSDSHFLIDLNKNVKKIDKDVQEIDKDVQEIDQTQTLREADPHLKENKNSYNRL